MSSQDMSQLRKIQYKISWTFLISCYNEYVFCLGTINLSICLSWTQVYHLWKYLEKIDELNNIIMNLARVCVYLSLFDWILSAAGILLMHILCLQTQLNLNISWILWVVSKFTLNLKCFYGPKYCLYWLQLNMNRG